MELRAANCECVAMSPDGSMLAIGNDNHTVQIWDVATLSERRVLTGHQSSVYAVAFSPDGKRLYTGSEDTTALAWDLATLLRDRPTGPRGRP